MKFEVKDQKPSHKFEVSDFEIFHTSKTRSFIALSILGICMTFLVGAAVHGLIVKDFSALKAVLMYVQTPLGALTGYYFVIKNG